MELTFYDTRPKEEKAPAEKRRESARPDGQSPAVGGPRELTPVKRRPLPSDPTGASPSPANTPEHRGLQGMQSGPRNYGSAPRLRQSEQTPTHQRRAQPTDTPQRRPLPDASPLNGTPASNHQTPQHQQYAPRQPEQEAYHTPPNPRTSSVNVPQYNEDGFDMSYTAPKPYEVQPVERAMPQDDFRSSHGHSHSLPTDLPHAHSAPTVPTQHMYEPEPSPQDPYGTPGYGSGHITQPSDDYSQDPYQDPSYQVEPLRLSRNSRSQEPSPHDPYQANNPYMNSHDPYDPYASHGRRVSAMQPTVEDEDDLPPPPPVHRSDAHTVVQHHHSLDYHDDAPAPLNTSRYRDEPSRYDYDSQPSPLGTNDYAPLQAPERRYTHPHPSSRPVSRDAMVPSPLRNDNSVVIPSSLVAGYDASRRESASYQTPPSYETPPRLRQHSEPDYRTPPQYDTPSRPHLLTYYQSAPAAESPQYYQHPPPEEPRRRSPVQDPAPIIKPRAVSPGASPANGQSPADARSSRTPGRSMPTRKSVSPRPPPSGDTGERRLSGVPFNPDSFDVYNPTVSKSSGNGSSDPDRPGSSMEVNEKGQVVTFNGRVIDASDHLPVDSWAPEPQRKGAEKDRPVRSRPALSGARDLEAARQREERYKRDRAERERIRNAATATFGSADNSPSTALVTARHNFNTYTPPTASSSALVLADRDATPPSAGGRNRLQKRNPNPRPMSSFDTPSPGIPMPNTNVLRERENLGGYGSSPGYSRHSVAAPPIPAKIPLDTGDEDMAALSLELQTIDIGPGSGGRRNRGTARRYGF